MSDILELTNQVKSPALKSHKPYMAVAQLPYQKAISGASVSGYMRLSDMVFTFLLGVLALKIHVLNPLTLTLISLLPIMISQLANARSLYLLANLRSKLRHPLRLLLSITLCFSIAYAVIGFLFLLNEPLQHFLHLWFMMTCAVLFFNRQVVGFAVRHWYKTGVLKKRTVIVGGGASGEILINTLKRQPFQECEILGIFDDRIDARSPDFVAGYHKLGNIDDLIEFARLTRVDLAICTIPMTAETRVLKMMRKLWVLPIDIRLSAHTSQLKFMKHAYSHIGEAALMDISDKPLKESDIMMKSMFDRVIGLVALILLSPVMLLTALLIKLDSKGPVFFKQKRYGFNNEQISVWKFRSMRTDMLDFGGLKQVSKEDPRVTRIGKFIRKTSIDELPQLFNVVFAGNLSLVGPRPHSVSQHFFEEVVDGYFARHKVKPGITGWAQINGWRGETDTDEKMQKRVEFDLHYIENWSLLFDLSILAKTPYAVLANKENAY